MKTRQTVGQIIRAARDKKRLLQSEVAHDLKVSVELVRSIERDRRGVSVALLRPISRLLDIPLEKLVP